MEGLILPLRKTGIPQAQVCALKILGLPADKTGMGALYAMQLAVPVSQVALLLVLTTVCLVIGRIRLALLINYVFSLFWGYIFNRDLLIGSGEQISFAVYAYFGFGLAIVFFAMVGFLVHREE